jgi:hypothetical protein
MPKVSFSFSGWVRDAEITKAMNLANGGEDIDVSHLTRDELVEKLNSGELAISLSDAMDNSKESDAEISDYE